MSISFVVPLTLMTNRDEHKCMHAATPPHLSFPRNFLAICSKLEHRVRTTRKTRYSQRETVAWKGWGLVGCHGIYLLIRFLNYHIRAIHLSDLLTNLLLNICK